MTDNNPKSSPQSADASAGLVITITPVAATKVREYLDSENIPVDEGGIRVQVAPGGCSGFKYGLFAEALPRDDDVIVESNGIRVFVDPFTMQYLDGLTIDYEKAFAGEGFKLINPNSKGSCGCGKSDEL
jgi:iron-sulfur cluster assembly accessory protein